MRIDQLMSRDVHFCSPDQTLDAAAQAMWTHDCGCVPVCEGDGKARLVGMLTDRDICMAALFRRKPLAEIRIRDAMSQTIISCRPTDSPAEVEQAMCDRQIRRVPVTGDDGRLLGIVSLADLARGAQRRREPGSPTAMGVSSTLAAISAVQAH
jgi:CBS domain-containing protein